MDNNDKLILDILEAIEKTIGGGSRSLHEPKFHGNEIRYLKQCIDTGWVSSSGQFVDKFELDLAEYTGTKKAVSTVNGTAALHVCLKLCKVEFGDEVLVPTLTFIATANAISYCGATPHFIDSEKISLGVDTIKLDEYLHEITSIKSGICFNKKTGKKIKALVVMHTLGHPCDLENALEIAKKYSLELIEDAAESLGSTYMNKHTGNWGRLTALSFNGNKIITTGGGGAVLTNDEALGNYAKHLISTAKINHPWKFIHDQIGFNYRMPNINASIGCAQLEKIDQYLRLKRILHERYKISFQDIKGVRLFTESENSKSNYWLNAIAIEDTNLDIRDSIISKAHEKGFLVRPFWELLHTLDIYKNCPQMDNLEGAKNLYLKTICLPSSPFLAEENEKN